METQQWMGMLLVPFALLGFFCNWLIVFVIWRTKSFTHSFLILTLNQSFLEALHSSVYLFYVSPMIILDSKYLKKQSHHVGYLILILYDSSMQIHFIMTINRLLAVFTPFLCPKIFSQRNTVGVAVISFVCSFSVVTLFFGFYDCTMTYLDDMWMFEYSLQPLCQAYMNYNDITKITFFAIFNVVLDTITITKLSYKKQKLLKNSNSRSPLSVFNKKEVDFLKQSFSQGLAIFLGLSVYIFAPELVSDPIRAFLVSTLFWCFLHAFDGLTTILFNSDVQGYIRKSLEKRKSIIIVSSCIAL